MTQHKITESGNLLNDDGTLREIGFATSMLQIYNREKIKKSKLKIKEWDYYLISNEKFAVALTIADNGYMGMLSASLIEFDIPKEKTTSIMTLFPMGKFKMPRTSKEGVSNFSNKKCSFKFTTSPTGEGDKANRQIDVYLKNFDTGKDFSCHFDLTDEPKDSMVIATPYAEDKKAFYYNQKIIGMKASGWVTLGDTNSLGGEDAPQNDTNSLGNNKIENKIEFSNTNTTALLDWGRGVWTYENTWYWGAASGYIDGHSLGWNIGYGFGDTTKASENMVFFDGKAHKLDRIKFCIPLQNDKNADDTMIDEKMIDDKITAENKTFFDEWVKNPPNEKVHLDQIHNFTSPWKFTSNDGRFEMDFVPILDRASCTDLKLIMSDQHQVFGKFTGKIILDDGSIIQIKDFLGFAEKVHNKW